MTLFTGDKVRLAAFSAEAAAAAMARWSRDTEFHHLQNSRPAQPEAPWQTRARAPEDLEDALFWFGIHARQAPTAQAIGFLFLEVDGRNADAWLGVGIGDRENWGQGYGTDAVRVAVRYAFTELDLHRVSLTVLGANPRAQRAYEKAGFVVEGRARGLSGYAGHRVDEVYMGLLKREWVRDR